MLYQGLPIGVSPPPSPTTLEWGTKRGELCHSPFVIKVAILFDVILGLPRGKNIQSSIMAPWRHPRKAKKFKPHHDRATLRVMWKRHKPPGLHHKKKKTFNVNFRSLRPTIMKLWSRMCSRCADREKRKACYGEAMKWNTPADREKKKAHYNEATKQNMLEMCKSRKEESRPWWGHELECAWGVLIKKRKRFTMMRPWSRYALDV